MPLRLPRQQRPTAVVQEGTISLSHLIHFNVLFQLNWSCLNSRRLQGDVVTVLAEKDKGWWTASLDGRVGAIPYNYVKPLEEVSANTLVACFHLSVWSPVRTVYIRGPPDPPNAKV